MQTDNREHDLRRALVCLVNEAKHYRNTGLGRIFLDEAIANAENALNATQQEPCKPPTN